MTPKEKAEELVEKFHSQKNKFGQIFYLHSDIAKQCALIAVNEILDAQLFDLNELKYWQQVKKEIEIL